MPRRSRYRPGCWPPAAAALFAIAFAGSDLATRFQYAIMLVVGVALLAFFAGAGRLWSPDRLAESWAVASPDLGFWVLFAVFFPAVTGFTQGVSMSGDLRDPGRSLPRGTFAAVGVSIVVYSLAALAFAGSDEPAALRGDYLAFKRLTWYAPLFDAGVIAATLSSGLASFLGAPRILQAMARDSILRPLGPFEIGHGEADTPRRATLLTAGIAGGVLLAGSLNVVAGVITMFFLISYGLLNYATYVEARAQSPSFRPRFYHERASLVGALLCAGAMLAVDPGAAALAAAVMVAFYQYLKRHAVPAAWADSRRSYEFRRLKETLREIERHPESEWNWQPHVLVLASPGERTDLLVRFAGSISGASGIVTLVGIVEGEGDFESVQKRRREREEALRGELEELGVEAFALAVAAPVMRSAVATVLQTWGIGPVRANTVLLDWYERLTPDDENSDPLRYARQIRGVMRLGCNVVILDVDGKDWRRILALPPDELRIDVWWKEGRSSRLALLFAYLMTRMDPWSEARLRVLAPCPADQDQKLQGHLRALLEEARIDGEVRVIPDAGEADVVELSGRSALVFLPLEVEGMRISSFFGEAPEPVISELPIVCLVSAAGDVKLIEDDPAEVENEAEDPPDRARTGRSPPGAC